MNSEKRELLRNAILLALNSSAPFAIGLQAIKVMIKPYGFRDLDRDEVLLEIEYLIGKGLAEAVDKNISPENRQWKITAQGRDHLAMEGLA